MCIKDLFYNRVKNSNSDSRESRDYESDQDSGRQTNSEGLVPNNVADVPSDINLIDLEIVSQFNLSGGGPVSQFNPTDVCVCVCVWGGGGGGGGGGGIL